MITVNSDNPPLEIAYAKRILYDALRLRKENSAASGREVARTHETWAKPKRTKFVT